MNAQKGFTLIELMIVVAIIGILAAVAIPQYQNYIAKTQMSRVVGEISALKTSAEQYILDGQSATAIADLGFTTSNLVSATTAAVNPSNDGTVEITATLGTSAASSVAGAIVTLTRDATGLWECATTASTNAGWKDSYAPAGCPV